MGDTANFDPAKTDPFDAVMAQESTLANPADRKAAAGGSPEPAGDPPAPAAGDGETPLPAAGFKVGAPAEGNPADPAKPEPGKADPAKPEGDSPAKKDGKADPAKPESGKADPAKKDGEGDGEKKPPEYRPFTLPDGVAPDNDLLTAFTAKAGELGLTQDQAQALVDMQAQAALKGRAAEQKLVADFVRQQQEQFDKELEADPDVGGAFRQRTLKRANQAMRTFDRSGRLGALAAEWGISNQPDWVKFLEAVGATLEEDVAPRGKGGGAEQTTAQMLFPDLK